MNSITEIDGSVLEGGGQILRLAMAFSCLLKKSIRITKIRANRSKKGLRPQHLKGIQMVSEMCDGTLTGTFVDSTEITFSPGNLKAGNFDVDTRTAGSIALLIQVALPVALFAPSYTSFILKGGTNADMAPPVDYIISVFVPILEKFGGNCNCLIKRRGYYPKGGGVVEVGIPPIKTLSAVNMTEFGTITRVWGRSYVAGTLPYNMTNEMANVAEKILGQVVPQKIPIAIDRVKESPQEAFGNGFGIVLFAQTDTGCFLGSSTMGSRGMAAYDAGKQAAEELATSLERRYCLDNNAQDQVIILMALAKGKSVMKSGPLTEHTKTAIYIAETLTDVKFKVEENSGFCLLECEGIGFEYGKS